MNHELIERIKKIEFEALDNLDPFDMDLIKHNAIKRLQAYFPFHCIQVWESLNFNQKYDFDLLAESQKKIVMEMNVVFITIYDGMLKGADK